MADDLVRVPRVLVVDDDEDVVELFARLVERVTPSTIIRARTAEEALGRIGGDEIDVVITEVVLVGISGLALFRTVRERSPAAVGILVSSHNYLDEARVSGAAHFLLKPVSIHYMRGVIRLVLDRSERQSVWTDEG